MKRAWAKGTVTRSGVFVGGFVPAEVRDYLRARARREETNVTRVLIRLVREEMRREKGAGPPR